MDILLTSGMTSYNLVAENDTTLENLTSNIFETITSYSTNTTNGFIIDTTLLDSGPHRLPASLTPAPEDLRKPAYLDVLVTLFYCLIFLCGVVGNAMVILVVWRNKAMLNSTNVFLVNLSIADLCVILICMPSSLFEFYSERIWYLGDAICKYWLSNGILLLRSLVFIYNLNYIFCAIHRTCM